MLYEIYIQHNGGIHTANSEFNLLPFNWFKKKVLLRERQRLTTLSLGGIPSLLGGGG